MLAQLARRPKPIIVALLMLVLPKLAFVVVRATAEYLIGFLCANLYATATSFSFEAGLVATNLVTQFEHWLMYGSRKSGWAPPSFPGAPSPTSQARAAVQAVARAANLSEDMADQMCKAVDVSMRAVAPPNRRRPCTRFRGQTQVSFQWF